MRIMECFRVYGAKPYLSLKDRDRLALLQVERRVQTSAIIAERERNPGFAGILNYE